SRTDRMLGVNQSRICCLRRVVPFSGCRFSSRILRRRDDFEILVLQFAVDFLPAWQVESAASPGRPGDDEYFLPAEVAEMNHATGAVGHGESGRDSGVRKAAA